MHRTRVTAAVAALSILCGTAPASAQEWEGASPSELRDAVELFSADRAALSGRYGSYPPLHQAAYMLGALQFRALHQELVGSGRMTDREFHDAILRGGRMPVERVRLRLVGTTLTRDYVPQWRF